MMESVLATGLGVGFAVLAFGYMLASEYIDLLRARERNRNKEQKFIEREEPARLVEWKEVRPGVDD